MTIGAYRFRAGSSTCPGAARCLIAILISISAVTNGLAAPAEIIGIGLAAPDPCD
jgi:hypothetical protein